MKAGDWFRIAHKGHWGQSQLHQARRVKRELARGNKDAPILDLGIMVEFVIEDYFGQPCRHAIPLEWCQPAERPSVARRVKIAGPGGRDIGRRDEGRRER